MFLDLSGTPQPLGTVAAAMAATDIIQTGPNWTLEEPTYCFESNKVKNGKTTLNTHDGYFEYLVRPFGLSNFQAVF